MKTTVTILPGVTLSAVRSDKFKTGCFSVNFLRPLCREEASKNALTFSVLLRGTEKHPDIQSLSDAMDDLYGAEIGLLIRKKGEVQCVGLYCDYVEDAMLPGENIFSGVVALMAEMLLNPVLENGVFRRDYVEREKENLIHSIRSRLNSKRAWAVSRLVKTMFRDEAYGVDRLGEEEDVAPITPQTLYEHYRHILAASRVEICYMGRLPAQEVAEALRRALADLPRETVTPVDTVFVPAAGEVKSVTESLDVTQGKLCMGFRLGTRAGRPDWAAMVVLNSVYGSGVTSKLFVNVREKMSLCYYASASLEKFKGVMVVSSGIEFSQVETAKNAILAELEACRRGEITAEELDSAKKHLISSLRTSMDSPGQLDEYYLGQAISGTSGTIPEFISRVETVTAEDCAACARRITLDTVFFLKGTEA